MTDPGWPGWFGHHTLHRVSTGNEHRIHHSGGRLGLADCGAVCVPPILAKPAPRTRCEKCFTTSVAPI